MRRYELTQVSPSVDCITWCRDSSSSSKGERGIEEAQRRETKGGGEGGPYHSDVGVVAETGLADDGEVGTLPSVGLGVSQQPMRHGVAGITKEGGERIQDGAEPNTGMGYAVV
ncbi:hypothetical protein B296_00047639 [Ensete ventricosum]|uniref:Uncharacterized protein n=1 Tax=Ensete ventricosum TaxID=4639 RepID=A0A426XNN3_ENSVE|nr:hypothetical protein B296_00047639 [Ensete ventricosum]